MANFTKLLSSILVAVACASTAAAAPWPTTVKRSTHSVRLVGRDSELKLETYHPTSSFETFGAAGLDHAFAKRDDFDLEEATTEFVKSKLGIDSDSLRFQTGYSGAVSKNAFVKQQKNGIPFANAVANVAFNNDGRIASFGSSFLTPSTIADHNPSISVEDAIATAEKTLDGTYNQQPSSLEYFVLDDDTAALTHVVQIRNEEKGTWVEAFVDAHDNKVISVTDFVAKATYRVIPIRKQNYESGFETLTDPENTKTSPNGWLDGTKTSGNNALAYIGSESGTTSESSTGKFVYTADDSQDPTTANNKAAATTNAFYIVNSIHDIAYLYGFTEAAFNFQDDNLGNGGEGGDRVTISVQDDGGVDNADFSTPPDGQSGHMNMYLWDTATPERDGALSNDVISHEMTHGITNRMTGGGTGRCLQTDEAGGMGEGWSDAFAEWTEQSAAHPDYKTGAYVDNNPDGIRTYPYSTSKTTNPLTYESVGKLDEVHAIGEYWANLWHNIHAALIDEHGFADDYLTNPDADGGNVIFGHLFIDALPIQPCNPTFQTARDAIIQADANRYKGANKCLLWKVYASRGLGVNAKNYKDDATVPDDC
ncbi:Fungalysin metallopeptidase-domain-containing protein [Amylostereum chailletii]|nr:Fungalysin metallopeptidase-domain-containing protein [Amylostereum chailletii]